MQGSVVSIFRRNLAPDGFVLLADPVRQQSIDLLARLEDEGARFDLEMAYVEPICGLRSGHPSKSCCSKVHSVHEAIGRAAGRRGQATRVKAGM